MLVEVIESVDIDITPSSLTRIVRCADCRWYQKHNLFCGLYEVDKDSKGFCDEGLRRSAKGEIKSGKTDFCG